MAVFIWSPGMTAENAAVMPPDIQDRMAWDIHRRGTRAQIEADIAEAEGRLAAPEMDPGYAQFYSRPEFDERMRGVVKVLRLALAHKDREESDPRFARLYAALELARNEVDEALEAVYEKGLNVDLDALTQAVMAACEVKGS